jgi:thioredoxin 2
MANDKVKVSCGNCGTTNFFPLGAEGKRVVCGHCKTRLAPPGTVLEPSAAQMENLFRNSGLPILVDFYSPTCAPCMMMHPIVERLAKRRAGELVAVRINVESAPELAQSFDIRAVPTFVVVSKGVERARTAGASSEMDFSLWVASQT